MQSSVRILLGTAKAVLVLLPWFALPAQAGDPAEVDFLIRAGTVYDGSGAAGRVADVALRGERIVAVGKLADMEARHQINAAGLVVAPGFIDLHTHSDRSITRAQTRSNLNYLTQGVTTVVTGNCGGGPTDIQAMYAQIEKEGAGTNVIHLIPHGSVRRKVVGMVNRPATAEELEHMKRLVDREMKYGAWGISTGLIYTPGSYAPTEELIELARVAASHGGIYASHIRGEGADRLTAAIREALAIGREAAIPVHISHLKASGRSAWGMVQEACRLIEQARAAGQRVSADQYPYTASSTSLAAMLIPSPDREGGRSALLERLADPTHGPALRRQIARRLEARGGGGTIQIASYAKRPDWVGKSLEQIAASEGRSVVEMVVEIQQGGGASAVSFSMSEDDVHFVMRKPYVTTASDGSARVPDSTRPHPRSYGCFPRKIGRFAIEKGWISLEFALRSSSGLPANILELTDRGHVRPGYFADLVVFDPESFRDQATFDQPHQYSVGVRYLWVNGTLSIDEGRYTGALAGRPLRR